MQVNLYSLHSSNITGGLMKKGIIIIFGFVITLSLVIISINFVTKYNAQKDGVCAFYGADDEWLVTYTSIKVNGINYDNLYLKYTGYNDQKDYIDEFNYDLEGGDGYFTVRGFMEFRNSQDLHLIFKEENEGDGITDVRKCLELNLSIKSPNGWHDLTLKRVDVRYFKVRPYDVIDEKKEK
jgi:hypothetical protein